MISTKDQSSFGAHDWRQQRPVDRRMAVCPFFTLGLRASR
jgi:hypothetical protein